MTSLRAKRLRSRIRNEKRTAVIIDEEQATRMKLVALTRFGAPEEMVRTPRGNVKYIRWLQGERDRIQRSRRQRHFGTLPNDLRIVRGAESKGQAQVALFTDYYPE